MPPKKKAAFTRRKGVHAERPKARETGMGAAPKPRGRTRSAGPPAPPKPAVGKRERAPNAAPSHGLGEVLSAAMGVAEQRKQQREAAAAARAKRAEQRFSSPKPSARSTTGSGGGSMEVSPTGGSGTSGSPPSPDRKKSRPSNQQEEEEREEEQEGAQQQPTFEDSSDEEGAHKPPTPPPPTPPPKQSPLAAPRPKLATTVAAMAQTAGGASPTTDESPRVRPMVLRGDDQPAPHGRRQLLNRLITPEEREDARQKGQQRRRAREAAIKARRGVIKEILEDADSSLYDLLMAEFVVQPANEMLTDGQLKSHYLKQLYTAKDKNEIPRQAGVLELDVLRDALLGSSELMELLERGLTQRKVAFAEEVSGLPILGQVQAMPDETLMALFGRVAGVLRDVEEMLLPKMGRPPKKPSAKGFYARTWLDIYLEYVASDEYGGGTFLTFLEGRLLEMGVRDLCALHGVAKRAAGKANQAFIIEQRAEMRGRLVQAAMDGVLKYNAAALEGFRHGGGGPGEGDGEAEVIDVDLFDDVIVLE